MSAVKVEAIAGSEAWLGSDMMRSTDWIFPVPPWAVAELDAALRGVERGGLAWPHFGRGDFPLPTFSRDLSAVLDQLENGRGFALMRGFPVDRYSTEELKNLYWGVGTHLGSARYQNARGELIGEVRDEYRLYGEAHEVPADETLGRSSRSKARSSGPLRFHTDRCDVVTLLCVRQAQAGGASRIVSAVSVANAIRARRPDLHALLCQDYWRSRQGEELGGERQVYALPLFAARGGKFTTQYSRTFVEAAQKLPGVPRLTEAQDEALDLHAAVCEELAFTMEMRPATSSCSTTTSSITGARPTRTRMGRIATASCCACGSPRPIAASCRPGSSRSGARRRPARRAAGSPSLR